MESIFNKQFININFILFYLSDLEMLRFALDTLYKGDENPN